MATNQISMMYNLRQNSVEGTKCYGLWYPQPVRRSTLSLRGLSDHISEHGSVYGRDLVTGVLTKFTTCMVELITQGIAVKLDGLGTFYPTFEAKGVETPVNYDLNTNLKGVHIRFTPEDCDLDKISSRALKTKVSFAQNMIFDMNGVPKKIVDGELVDYGKGGDDDEQNP